MQFDGKGIVVTGAAGVFGRWIAAAFAREGAKLCLSDIRMDGLEEVATELGLNPKTTILHATELTEEASIADLAAKVQSAWGAPDAVVNNAGIYRASSFSNSRPRIGTGCSTSTCGRPFSSRATWRG